jgi:hypothetical protein
MTIAAVLGRRRMFEDMRATYILVTLRTLSCLADQPGLLAAMLIMATGAGHPAFLDRVVRTHVEAGQYILVAGGTQPGGLVGTPEREIEALVDLGSMHAVAVAALDPRLVVIRKFPVHALVIILMAGQTLRRSRPGRNAEFFLNPSLTPRPTFP